MSYGNNQRSSGVAKNSRPGRTLTITVLLMAVLYGVAFAIGATSINLGLDLRGGTSVTLQPRLQAGQEGQVTAEAIDQAVSIIRQRVNSLGVAEAEVAAEGTGERDGDARDFFGASALRGDGPFLVGPLQRRSVEGRLQMAQDGGRSRGDPRARAREISGDAAGVGVEPRNAVVSRRAREQARESGRQAE